MRYYSQNGEDFILEKIFNKNRGYFVEIGCLDGIEFSNTYFFERKGWKGICVEAHSDFIEKLKKNRPNSQVIHCAVGEANKQNVIFYANKGGSLSTLDKSEEQRWRKNYASDFHSFEEQLISMRTLTSIFDELHPSQIDFISIDIEGYEVKALEGLDLVRYRPKVFVIEYKDEAHQKSIQEILFKAEYFYLGKIGCNLFYGLNINDIAIVNGSYDGIKLISFDRNGVESEKIIQLGRVSFFRRAMRKLKRLFFLRD